MYKEFEKTSILLSLFLALVVFFMYRYVYLVGGGVEIFVIICLFLGAFIYLILGEVISSVVDNKKVNKYGKILTIIYYLYGFLLVTTDTFISFLGYEICYFILSILILANLVIIAKRYKVVTELQFCYEETLRKMRNFSNDNTYEKYDDFIKRLKKYLYIIYFAIFITNHDSVLIIAYIIHLIICLRVIIHARRNGDFINVLTSQKVNRYVLIIIVITFICIVGFNYIPTLYKNILVIGSTFPFFAASNKKGIIKI